MQIHKVEVICTMEVCDHMSLIIPKEPRSHALRHFLNIRGPPILPDCCSSHHKPFSVGSPYTVRTGCRYASSALAAHMSVQQPNHPMSVYYKGTNGNKACRMHTCEKTAVDTRMLCTSKQCIQWPCDPPMLDMLTTDGVFCWNSFTLATSSEDRSFVSGSGTYVANIA